MPLLQENRQPWLWIYFFKKGGMPLKKDWLPAGWETARRFPWKVIWGEDEQSEILTSYHMKRSIKIIFHRLLESNRHYFQRTKVFNLFRKSKGLSPSARPWKKLGAASTAGSAMSVTTVVSSVRKSQWFSKTPGGRSILITVRGAASALWNVPAMPWLWRRKYEAGIGRKPCCCRSG